MRTDPVAFASENEAQSKRPRFVIQIEYDVESIYMTSHAGISGIPGIVMENVLRKPSAVSQRIVPDEGRSEIGSFAFSLVDLNSVFTQEIREKLGDGKGLRGKKVRFWVGYARFAPEESGGFGEGGFGEGGFGEGEAGTPPEAVFSEFQLFQTQIITGVSYDQGLYDIKCADITREQRADIFDVKRTTLRDTISATATTVPVYSTVGFQPVYHGPSYSDGPNGVYGYIKVQDEWVRYTGLTADSFTGCTRGVLNTKAVEHTVDPASDADRRPKVEEGIYLELPAAKLTYAVLTGIIHGTSPTQTLPPHWHLGIDPDLVRLSDFTGIGTDLWNPSLDTDGFVTRFQGLSKIDGKKFLETELYMLLGCYSPIYSDGTIGLKRMNQVLADAAFVTVLDSRNIISHGALEHDMGSLHNRLQIDWNWNGDRFTRSTLFVDAQSVTTHGPAPLKKLQFKGLHGSRHTEAIIRKRLDSFRDRYTSVPETTTVDVLSSLNRLEVGDIVRDRMRHVRDYAGSTQDIDRSFEIQRRSVDYITGDVTLELFGSTAPASAQAPNNTGSGGALPDAFYNSAGTELSTVATIVVVGGVGVIQAGTYNLTAGIYYYLGDLELADGATLTINGTVQIRVRGFFTINGDIDGVGRGKAGQAGSGEIGVQTEGLSGFLGNSRGMDGIIRNGGRVGIIWTSPCAFTRGQYAAFPYLELTVSGSSLLGIPADLAGTSGGAGGKLGSTGNANPASATVVNQGGTGGDSGAGLVIISRGLAFGASGAIDLSGDDAAATSPVTMLGQSVYPGPGGAGAPGALLILLDGSSVFVPDLGGKFTAACGNVPVNGNPITSRRLDGRNAFSAIQPIAGYLDESMISNVDLSNVAYRIQYIPGAETPQEDQNDKPAAPTALSIIPAQGFLIIRATVELAKPLDVVQVYASIDNNRTNAVRLAEGAADEFTHELPPSSQRWYWTRVRRPTDGPDVYSDWFPASATAGAQAIAFGDLGLPDPEFLRAIDGTYWTRSSPTKMPITTTGGQVGGLLTMDFNEASATSATRTLTPAGPLPTRFEGQSLRIVVRYRRTSTISAPNNKKLQLDVFSFQTLDGTGSANLEDLIDVVADMSTLPLNVWQTSVITVDPTSSYPFYRVRLLGTVDGSGASTGTLEVDYFNVYLSNAATDVVVTAEPADGNEVYASATQPVVEVTGLNGYATYTSPANMATQVSVAWSAQGRISNTTSGVAVGEARLRVRVFIDSVEVFTQWLVLEGYTATDAWGNFAGSRDFDVPAGQEIEVYLQTGRSFSTGGSSPAQTMYWREALINLVGHRR